MNVLAGIAEKAKQAAGALKNLLGSGEQTPTEQEIASQLMAAGFGSADEVVRWVESEFDRRLREQQPWHLQWRLNIDYMNGYQFRFIDPAAGDIRDIPNPYRYKVRRAHNQILPTVIVRTAKLSRARPALKARPSSSDQGDVATAKTSAKVLSANEQDQNWASKYMEALTWMESCGSVVTKEVWDRTKGRPLGEIQVERSPKEVPPAEGASPEANRQPVMERQVVREGNVDTVICPPTTIFPDSPWRSDIDHCRSLIEARAYPVEEIYQTYGVLVDPENVTGLGLQQNIVTPGAPRVGPLRIAPVQLSGHAIVKEYWEKPSTRFPEGRFIVVANKKLLHVGPLPYKCGPDNAPDLPYTFWWSVRVPGCLWGKAIVELLIPLQQDWNDIKNGKMNFLKKIAHGQWTVQEGAVEDLDEFAENAGCEDYVVVYKTGHERPMPVSYGDLPSAYDREENSILNEWAIISGISDVSRKSEAPPGVKSGVALSIAVEQDDTRMAATVENITTAAVRQGKIRLRLFRQFATADRMGRYVGADNQVDVFYWKGSDLTSEDLFVENSSALAESPSQRRQMVFDLWKEGFFNDPETGKLDRMGRLKLMEMLQMGNWEDGTDIDALQVSKQDREIQRLLQGQQAPVGDIDEDLIHLSRLVRYMLTSEYEDAISDQLRGQAVQMAFEAHREAHLNQLAMTMVQQMGAQMPAMEQGAPMP